MVYALVAIFLPSFLLVIGAPPFWDAVRDRPGVQQALRGINAAVVAVWASAIAGPRDFTLALAAFALLVLWRQPEWLVVVLAALAATIVARVD